MTTPREQLARILYIHCTPYPDGQTSRAQCWDNGEVSEYATEEPYMQADAIIAAGWAPPPAEATNTTTEN